MSLPLWIKRIKEGTKLVPLGYYLDKKYLFSNSGTNLVPFLMFIGERKWDTVYFHSAYMYNVTGDPASYKI